MKLAPRRAIVTSVDAPPSASLIAAMSATPPPETEHTRWSPGLIGFYLSCAGVALGATIAGGSHFFFESLGGTIFGAVMSGVSCFTCYFSLRAARRPPDA